MSESRASNEQDCLLSGQYLWRHIDSIIMARMILSIVPHVTIEALERIDVSDEGPVKCT